LYWYGPGCNQYLPLTETAPGTYTAQWDAVTYCNFSNPYPHVLPDTNYTVYVRDAAGNQSAVTGVVTIQGVSAVSASPSPFTPGGSNVLSISVTAVTGSTLRRVYLTA